MNIKQKIKSDFSYIVTAPKCGTHLLTSVLRSFGVETRNIYHFKSEAIKGKGAFLIEDISFEEATNPSNRYYTTIRDPRDATISAIRHFRKIMSSENVSITEDIQLMLQGKGLFGLLEKQVIEPLRQLAKIRKKNVDNILIVRFEDLILPSMGGSSDILRMKTFKQISQFTGQNYSDKKIISIMNEYRKNTPTFDPSVKQKAGQWKYHFTAELIQAFEEKYGDLIQGLGYVLATT